MASSTDDEAPAAAASCASCGAALAADQRYCLSCGARRGALPAAVADASRADERGRPAATDAPPRRAAPAALPRGDDERSASRSFMPSPRAAAVAVMALLAFGVVLGSADQPARAERRPRLDRARSEPTGAAPEAAPKKPSAEAGTGAEAAPPPTRRRRSARSQPRRKKQPPPRSPPNDQLPPELPEEEAAAAESSTSS